MQIRESYSKYFDKQSRMSRNQIKEGPAGQEGYFPSPQIFTELDTDCSIKRPCPYWMLLQIFKPSAGSVMYIHGLHHCFATEEFVHAPDYTMGWNFFLKEHLILLWYLWKIHNIYIYMIQAPSIVIRTFFCVHKNTKSVCVCTTVLVLFDKINPKSF